MKKIFTFLVMAALIVSFTSCGHSPYKKRKKCTGNGSWYGNRNLGYMVPLPDTKPDKKTYYVGTTSNSQEKL